MRERFGVIAGAVLFGGLFAVMIALVPEHALVAGASASGRPTPRTLESSPPDAPSIVCEGEPILLQGEAPPATPIPVSGTTGLQVTAGYSTEYVDTESVISENGLCSVTSTAPGTFALSGVVYDLNEGQPVVGATVVLGHVAGTDGRGPIVAIARTTSEAEGGWAFIDVAVDGAGAFDLRILSPGYGRYTAINGCFIGNETYFKNDTLEHRAKVIDQRSLLGCVAP